jgi:uncharacterized lipoprotein YajG
MSQIRIWMALFIAASLLLMTGIQSESQVLANVADKTGNMTNATSAENATSAGNMTGSNFSMPTFG